MRVELLTYTHPWLQTEQIQRAFDAEFQNMVYEIEERSLRKCKRVVVRLFVDRHRPVLSRFDATGRATLPFKGLKVRLLPQDGLNPWAKPFVPRA